MNTTSKLLLIFLSVLASSCNIIKIGFPVASFPVIGPKSDMEEQTFTISQADTGLSISRLDYLSLSFVAPQEGYVLNVTLDTSKMRSELEDSIYLLGGVMNFAKRFECVVHYSLSKSVVRDTRFYKQEDGGYDFYIPSDTTNNSNLRSLYKFRQVKATLRDSMLKGYQFEIIDPNGNYFRFVGHTDPLFLIPVFVIAATSVYIAYKAYKASKSHQATMKTNKGNDCYTKAKVSSAYQSNRMQYSVVKSNCD